MASKEHNPEKSTSVSSGFTQLLLRKLQESLDRRNQLMDLQNSFDIRHHSGMRFFRFLTDFHFFSPAEICFFFRKFRFYTKKRNLPIFRFRKKILGKYARPCGLTPLARKLADSSTDESTLYQQALQG
ncbi:hypothetical protein AVEN_198481-1 [Araneus ventricosus]|uniref:Uncharacterized protein n=1 Tax=Araneus ventricosus TaxID=182803 RepID=A0A4Y2MTY7_ARAVE|nr:hypothetical protein AVEN_198481-1 [Araneus ventricosus]